MDIFEVKITASRTNDDGSVKDVKESYIAQAVSVTDAEAMVVEKLAPYGDLQVISVTKKRYSDIVIPKDEQETTWFLARYAEFEVDERSGKEKIRYTDFVLGANDFENAYNTLKDYLKECVYDTSICRLIATPIIDVFISK